MSLHTYFLKRCVNASECKAAYDQALEAEIVAFEALDIPSVAAQVFEQMRDALFADPRKEEKNTAIQEGVDAVIQFARTRPAAVRAQINGG